MEIVDRRKLALQISGALCLLAVVPQLLGGNLLFLIDAIGYAMAGAGLIKQSRSDSRWGARLGCVWAAINGTINVLTAGFAALFVNSELGSTQAPFLLVNNLVWLAGNVLIFITARWGSKSADEGTRKSLGIF